MTRVKICGITNIEDARLAVDAGADAIGLIFADSPRRIDAETAQRIVRSLPPMVGVVGVFVDPTYDEIRDVVSKVQLDVLQLHGDESPEFCTPLPHRVIKRFNILETDTTDTLRDRMAPYSVSAYLLDPGAGGGKVFDWSLARGLPEPLIVSGGLNAENVADAVRTVRPYGVDVCSGVESGLRRKDACRVRAFVDAVRNAG